MSSVLPLLLLQFDLNIILPSLQNLAEEVSLVEDFDSFSTHSLPVFCLDSLSPKAANIPLDIPSQVPSIAVYK